MFDNYGNILLFDPMKLDVLAIGQANGGISIWILVYFSLISWTTCTAHGQWTTARDADAQHVDSIPYRPQLLYLG